MAYGFLKPVASLNGLPCSGHGLCLPSTIHSVQACGTPPIPYTIYIKNFTCWWPPLPLIPLVFTPERATLLVNLIPVALMGDTFVWHISVCTNTVIYLCPCGKAICAIFVPIPCSILTVEDSAGVGHIRVLMATSITVFGLKRPIGRILDPLGVGFPGFSYPCSSVIAFGHPTVLSA